MVDFRKMTTPRGIVQNKRVRGELASFSGLERQDQARKILEISRKAFDFGGYPEDATRSYDEWALLRVLPEIARRIDPSVTLLSREIPSAEEALKDPVTDVRDADLNTMSRYVRNIKENGSFAKVRGDDPESRDIHDMFAVWRDRGILVRAMHVLAPEEWPIREETEADDLSGRWIILEAPNGSQTVLNYLDGPEMDDRIQELLSQVRSWVADPTCDEAADIRLRLSYNPRRGEFSKVMVQDIEAVVWHEEELQRKNEMEFHP